MDQERQTIPAGVIHLRFWVGIGVATLNPNHPQPKPRPLSPWVVFLWLSRGILNTRQAPNTFLVQPNNWSITSCARLDFSRADRQSGVVEMAIRRPTLAQLLSPCYITLHHTPLTHHRTEPHPTFCSTQKERGENGERPKGEEDVLQGEEVQETHSAQGVCARVRSPCDGYTITCMSASHPPLSAKTLTPPAPRLPCR